MDENKEKDKIRPQEGPESGAGDASEARAGGADGKGKPRLRNTLLTLLSIGLMLFALIIVARQYVYIPGRYEAPPTPPQPAASAPQAADEAPPAAPSPTPYVRKIPVKMYFTEREMSFPVETVGLVPYTDGKGREVKDENGDVKYTMGAVDTEKAAAWLEDSVSPGEYGNAIFNGHISWHKVAGVFSVLPKMEEGEEIVVGYDDGSAKSFTVSQVIFCDIDSVPDYVLRVDTGDSRITLITCYGEGWNKELGTRNNRCIVIAKPDDGEIIPTPVP